MHGGKLTREEVAPLLDTDDAALQSAALAVIGKHPEWADQFTDFLRSVLDDGGATDNFGGGELSSERQSAIRGTLVALRGQAEVEKLAAEALARENTRPAIRQLLLEVAAASAHPSLAEAWREPIRRCLISTDEAIVRHAVAAVAAIGDLHFDEPLLQLARDHSRPADLRIAALAARANPDASLDAESFSLLAAQFKSDVPTMQRLEAARAVGKARLDAEQQAAALALLAVAGPLEIGPLLDAFDLPGDAKLGIALVDALDKSRGRASVPAAHLEQVLANYPQEARSHAESLLAALRGDTSEQAERLTQLESQISPGNADRGRSIFTGSRATCITCHRVAGDGGSIGPDLSDVASRRSSRDLLEAIAIPSASLARGYESYVVVTSDGRVVTGLVTRETADALVIRTPQQTEVRIARGTIEELRLDSTSIMPAGLTEVLTADELSDLLAYLQSLKAP
jgi:putative heme-binding domain-containing protein